MKKTGLMLAVMALAFVSIALFSVPVFADEAKPSNSFKNIEAGRWEALNYTYYGGGSSRGQQIIDCVIIIEEITPDGKVLGTYNAKPSNQKDFFTVQINPKIQTTPDGLPRLTFDSIKSQKEQWTDMQSDGSFKLFNGVVLKRVK